MEDKRWLLLAAIAPVVWGSTYFVTKTFLPPEPLWGATLRALPAGLVLLVVVRRLPRRSWWWKAVVLGILNVGAFFVLVYQAATLLPTSIASTVMAAAPIALALVAWLVVHERPSRARLSGAVIGLGGVCLLLLGGAGRLDWGGVAASCGAMLTSSIGFVLGKRWNPEVGVLASTAWQLVVGGVLLLAVAIVMEGAPPPLGPRALGAAVYLTVVATAVAYLAWFAALGRLRSDAVGLVGLLNPVVGVLLGVAVAGDHLGIRQDVGLVLVLVGIGVPLLLTRRRHSDDLDAPAARPRRSAPIGG